MEIEGIPYNEYHNDEFVSLSFIFSCVREQDMTDKIISKEIDTLKRIAECPTENKKLEEVDEMA